jgi:hypothetical protein
MFRPWRFKRWTESLATIPSGVRSGTNPETVRQPSRHFIRSAQPSTPPQRAVDTEHLIGAARPAAEERTSSIFVIAFSVPRSHSAIGR